MIHFLSRPARVILLSLWFAAGVSAASPQQYEPAQSAAQLLERGRYDEAIALLENAVNQFPADTGLAQRLVAAYVAKWQVLLKRWDFDTQTGLIRADILKLLGSGSSEAVLGGALRGYELLGDGDAQLKIEERILSEYPAGSLTRQILARRAFSETDVLRRPALLEAFVARYPGDARAADAYRELFRIRARDHRPRTLPLLPLGEAWIGHVDRTAYSMVNARVDVALALAERRESLDRADALAAEVTKLAEELQPQSPLLDREPVEGRPMVIRGLRERAALATAFVHLRQGQWERAAAELNGALQTVRTQVERDGFILWKDADLREIGLRPRIFWLAELYEGQADYERGARYLLAGMSDDPELQEYIRERLTNLYTKLARPAADADSAVASALARYRSMTTRTAALLDDERIRLLSTRTQNAVPVFRALRSDKREASLADFRGKVGVLVFWATWCGPCLAELPQLETVFERYRADPKVAFLAISVDENRLAAQALVRQRKFAVPVAYDIDASQAFGVHNVPALLVIDRAGRVAFREEGYGGAADRYVERLMWRIESLLGETPAIR